VSLRSRLVLAGILLVVGLFGEAFLEFVKANVEIVKIPSVDVDEPSLEYKTLVKPITDMDIETMDARQIGDFFLELSNVVETDPGFVKSTGVFREFNIRAGGLNFSGLGLKDKYPLLGQEIDQAIVNTIGKEDSSLTDDKRKDLCNCLKAISWGVNN